MLSASFAKLFCYYCWPGMCNIKLILAVQKSPPTETWLGSREGGSRSLYNFTIFSTSPANNSREVLLGPPFIKRFVTIILGLLWTREQFPHTQLQHLRACSVSWRDVPAVARVVEALLQRSWRVSHSAESAKALLRLVRPSHHPRTLFLERVHVRGHLQQRERCGRHAV